MSEQSTQLSRSAHERLSAELEELTTVGRTRIAQLIEAARALGDLSENGDYHAAKDEQGRMETRIRQLQAMLKNAEIVDDTGGGDTIKIGSIVTLTFDGGDPERYLVGSIEERPEGVDVLTPHSPLGKMLIGKGPGEYDTQFGRVAITSID
jgi:transcription elongation factor GreA